MQRERLGRGHSGAGFRPLRGVVAARALQLQLPLAAAPLPMPPRRLLSSAPGLAPELQRTHCLGCRLTARAQSGGARKPWPEGGVSRPPQGRPGAQPRRQMPQNPTPVAEVHAGDASQLWMEVLDLVAEHDEIRDAVAKELAQMREDMSKMVSAKAKAKAKPKDDSATILSHEMFSSLGVGCLQR
eukprot:351229-Chlamydomonas_euryale.AAC.2